MIERVLYGARMRAASNAHRGASHGIGRRVEDVGQAAVLAQDARLGKFRPQPVQKDFQLLDA